MNQILILSLICASIAYTITEAGIFSEVREFFQRLNHKVGELFSCGYCMGHWISFFLVFVYRPRIIESSFIILDYFLTAIFIAWLSGFQWRLMVWFGQRISIMKLERIKLESSRR